MKKIGLQGSAAPRAYPPRSGAPVELGGGLVVRPGFVFLLAFGVVLVLGMLGA